jgi:hypothetical protein
MSQWYEQPELDPDMAIITSASGYSDDEISLEWLQHFDEHSRRGMVGKYRLLIFDGHDSHFTWEFVKYCEDHDIVPFGLPPHLTHLIQPLDVVVFQPLKHYHAKELDILIRDGLVNITKIEFLVVIQQARKQAFKEATNRAAFKKTGIWPFQPSIVLQVIQERQAVRTPSPPADAILNSSPFATPVTLRQMNKVADKLATIAGDIDHLQQFIKGSLATATELVQVKRDLQRTKMAENIANRRRLQKNRPLQSGGVLTVAQARRKVKFREDYELAKARRLVEAAEQKERNKMKRFAADVAKEARKWRLTGRLEPAEVVEEVGKIRLLRRV